MRDEEKESMLLSHDKDIGLLASSVEHLAVSVSEGNKKLDDIIEVMNTQNVIVERMDNLDNNLKESFGRVHNNIEHIETEVDLVKQGQSKFIASNVLLWGLGVMISYSIVFGTYTVQSIHDADTEVEKLRGAFNKDIAELRGENIAMRNALKYYADSIKNKKQAKVKQKDIKWDLIER